MSPRRCAATTITAAALFGGSTATAAADPLVVDRYEAGDDTVFTLTAGSALTGKPAQPRGVFTVKADPPEGSTSPYAGQDGPVSRAKLRLAGRQFVVVGSAVACSAPGATAVYGTVVRRARRVTATLKGGRTVKLARKKAPKAWKFDGWVIGAVVGVRKPVLEVRAYGADGVRIARAVFSSPQDCG